MTDTSKAEKFEWWHTEPNSGRRIGWMTPERFDAILSGFYGTQKWVKLFCDDYDITPASVYRWLSGATPIKKETAMIATIMADRKRPDRMPRISAPWLPERGDESASETDMTDDAAAA